MRVRDTRFEWGTRTYLMAIVNVTPDSFSGDGRDVRGAVEHAVAQWNEGADILDIGGESTRPGAQTIPEDLERARVVPVIAAVRERLPNAVISVDTYKPQVARAAHAAGADIVNCVWGAPAGIIDAAAELAMPLCAMHNQAGTQYEPDVVSGVVGFLRECALRAQARGIPRESIVLDPGIGFGKTADQNLILGRELARVCALGFPTLIGASRKSTIGKLTDREPSERVYATAATTALAIAAGVDIVRVHDVRAQRDAARVSDAIVRGWRPSGWTG